MSDVHNPAATAADAIIESGRPGNGTVDISNAQKVQTYDEYTAHQAKLAEAREFGALPSADVKTAKEAQAALEARTSSKVFYDRLMRGDIQATRDWDALNKIIGADPGNVKLDAVLDGTAAVPNFEITHNGELDTRKLMAEVAEFRELGFSDDTIRQALNGGTVTKAEYDAVALMQKRLVSDPEWGKKLVAGDFEAKRQMKLISIVLNCDVEGQSSKAKF